MLHNCIFSPPCRSGPYRSFCVRSPVHIWFSECNVNLWPLILTDSKNDLLGWRCPDPCDWEANKEGFLVFNASIAIESRKLRRTSLLWWASARTAGRPAVAAITGTQSALLNRAGRRRIVHRLSPARRKADHKSWAWDLGRCKQGYEGLQVNCQMNLVHLVLHLVTV
jgi:hypothetical protein